MRVRSILLAILLVPVLALAALVGLLVAWSPGKPKPITDVDGRVVPGSLSEKSWVRINGLDQGMFIKAVDPTKPVLLFVHGGPGMPGYWLTHWYPTVLEQHFTVCWWEQRGACLSYRPDIPPETMVAEQFVDDLLAVADYLRERFGQDRIFLMGHSWGSYVAIQAVAKDPSKFHAYVGVAQVVHQIRSERLSWEYMLERFREAGNTEMTRRLEAAPVTEHGPLPAAYDAIRDKAMHMLGVGTTHDMRSVVIGIFLRSWWFPEYTLREKVNLWRGKVTSRRSGLWDRMQATNLAALVTELKVPAYFLHGVHDYTCCYSLGKAYAAEFRAPLVGFYSFEHSAHSPFMEEPERTMRILTEDVLQGRTTLADPIAEPLTEGTRALDGPDRGGGPASDAGDARSQALGHRDERGPG